MFKKLLSKNSGTKAWPEDDEYQRARWAYEGESVATNRANLILCACLVVVGTFAVTEWWDNRNYEKLSKLQFVGFETNRTTGELVSVNAITGEVMADETKRRQFVKWWLTLLRQVPADAVAYNQNYMTTQMYMSDTVDARISEYMSNNPIERFLQSGHTRTVLVENVTSTGNDGTRYRIDWIETVYRNSKIVTTTPMTADLDLEEHAPATDAEAEANLFGFVVKGFYWTPPAGM